MHPLLSRLLEHRQLSSAGPLFAINHYDVISDLPSTLAKMRQLLEADDYATDGVAQSVVEIAVARVTAAIRETGCIESFACELVALLDAALRRDALVAEEVDDVESPYCKIANDLLSSLFLHYARKSVMTVTLPVAVRALDCVNSELVRNTTNYISLAAIHNGKALSHYALEIISHILCGNYALVRVLPQIYNENREPIHAHLELLLQMLNNEEVEVSEKLSLLQLSSMVANTKPDVLIPYLSVFEDFLLSPSTCTAVLNIFMSLVSQGQASSLSSFLPSLSIAAKSSAFLSNRVTICKIIANVGRCSSVLAPSSVALLVDATLDADPNLLHSVLLEIEGVGAAHPSSLLPHIEVLQVPSSSPSKRVVERIIALTKTSRKSSPLLEKATKIDSIDSLQSKNGMIASGTRTMFPVCDSSAECSALELDRNTLSLAAQYHRSSGSLGRNSKSHTSVSLHGQRSTSEVGDSNDVSLLSMPTSSKQNVALATKTLPHGFAPITQIQMGKDGRVRPVGGGRRPVQWPAGSTETTFPAHPTRPVTSKMLAVKEDEEWNVKEVVDRSDLVQQFVEHRKNKIRRFVGDVTKIFPVPVQCTVEGSKNSKHRMVVHFPCQHQHSQLCVFPNDYLFAFKTKYPSSWLHLMFLQMECSCLTSTGQVAGKDSQQFRTLANCWDCLPLSLTRNVAFDTLVTSAFPTPKDQAKLQKELEEAGFFDSFSVDSSAKWTCISCSDPDKVRSWVEDGSCEKVFEGQLKEKKGRWRFLRRWHTKYFTLSSAALNYSSQQVSVDSRSSLPAIDLRKIKSVRSLGRGKKSRKSLRKAFEIFTSDNNSMVLKARDEKNAEEWLQCLQIAVANARREHF